MDHLISDTHIFCLWIFLGNKFLKAPHEIILVSFYLTTGATSQVGLSEAKDEKNQKAWRELKPNWENV